MAALIPVADLDEEEYARLLAKAHPKHEFVFDGVRYLRVDPILLQEDDDEDEGDDG